MTKREQYLENIGLVKTIMMLVIVAFHSIANWGVQDWFLNRSKLIPMVAVLAEWMSSFHTSAFVFASGFIFYSVSTIGNHYNSLLQFEIKKAKRLLVPYIFVSALWCIPTGMFVFNYTLYDVFKKYGLGLSPAQLWFLLMLFGVYSIFYFLGKTFKSRLRNIVFAVASLYAISLILRRYVPNICMIWRTADMLPVFTAGYILNEHIDRVNVKVVMTCSALLHLGLIWVHMRLVLSNPILSELVILAMHTCGSCFVFIAIASIGIRFHKIRENRYIVFFQKRSMAIYLIHQQLIWLFLFFTEDKMSPYISMPFMFAVVLLSSASIAGVLLKYNPTRIMIGEKSLAKGDQL